MWTSRNAPWPAAGGGSESGRDAAEAPVPVIGSFEVIAAAIIVAVLAVLLVVIALRVLRQHRGG